MNALPYSFCAAILALGIAHGQTTAYTAPVGYTTQTLLPNTFNNVGLNVLTPTLVAGTLTNVVNEVLTDSAADFITALPVGKMCTIEITSGTAIGAVQEFISWTGTTITLPGAITGLQIGDKYVIRKDPTLQELFPAGAPLTGGALDPTNADIVWVPDGTGGYTKYWYKTNVLLGAIGWWTTVNGTTRGAQVTLDIPLLYTDGILVQRKAGVNQDLVISGEVKKVASAPYILSGFNTISINPPAGLTLFTAGFYPTNFTGGALDPINADILWVPNGVGGYTKYWYKTNALLGPIGWWTTVDGASRGAQVVSDVILPPAVKIQRKSTGKYMSIAVPSEYVNF